VSKQDLTPRENGLWFWSAPNAGGPQPLIWVNIQTGSLTTAEPQPKWMLEPSPSVPIDRSHMNRVTSEKKTC